MPQLLKCFSCGSEIDADVSFRQCPKCLLDLGLLCKTPPKPESTSFVFIPDRDGRPWLPDYEVLERVGRGGMGMVYRARQLSLNRVVALKVLSGGDLASPAMLARFRREAEAAAKLDHPNVVPIYEVGEYEANPFLVMRFIEGASLADKLSQFALAEGSAAEPIGRSNTNRQQIKIALLLATIARAVHYAHGRGVLHRDLKPSNILLDGDGHPHLTDFGIAKFVGQETALTQTSELVGTPCYMSPEQVSGKTLTAAADIYSLGVILYELLTGRRPFDADRSVEVLRKVLEEEPKHPGLVNGAVDVDLAIICLKCLEKDSGRRYASGLALAEDLERWLRHEPIMAQPAGPIRRLNGWTVRNPALATLIVGLVVGMALTLALLAKAREEKSRKSIALAILRTEAARQLQEIWASPSACYTVKSETLSAMAGRDPAQLKPVEKRFTFSFPAEGNPLDRVLGVAPLLEQLEQNFTKAVRARTRIDLRLYKNQAQAVASLVAGESDLIQMNVREYLRAKLQDSGIQPLVSLVPLAGPARLHGQSAVIFTRADSGIRTIADLRGRSFLFGARESMPTFWARVCLVEAGLRAKDLASHRYLEMPEQLPDSANSYGPAPSPSTLGNPFSEMTPVAAVLANSYDAAVATERRFLQVAAKEKLVLLKRFQDAGSMLVGRSKLSPQAVATFQQSILDLKDPQILQSFPGYPSRFEPCTEKDFAEMQSKLTLEALFDENSPPEPKSSSNN